MSFLAGHLHPSYSKSPSFGKRVGGRSFPELKSAAKLRFPDRQLPRSGFNLALQPKLVSDHLKANSEFLHFLEEIFADVGAWADLESSHLKALSKEDPESCLRMSSFRKLSPQIRCGSSDSLIPGNSTRKMMGFERIRYPSGLRLPRKVSPLEIETNIAKI